jgi:hypothetical protein
MGHAWPLGADINMNVVVPCGHVCEIQLHHRGIVDFEKEHYSHDHYEVKAEVHIS